MKHIYLDHAATTPLDPEVLAAMMPYLTDHFGNASSVHALGRKARFAVEESRERVAACLGAEPSEIIFTSGGSEANNLALYGLPGERRGILTSRAEHEAVLRPAEYLREAGRNVDFLSPAPTGAVTPGQLQDALSPDVGLVSLMHANNEVGTLTPIREIARRCHENGVLLHSDAVQTAGLYALDVDELGVDALTLSAHKFYGPKGVGVLYVRGGTELKPLIRGGAQERRRRAGTEQVAAIVGMAEALERAVNEAPARLAHLEGLRRRLYKCLRERLGDLFICNTPLEENASAPHLLNIAFPPHEGRPFDGEMLILGLDMEGVAVSSGSACTSGAIEPSHVLRAIGLEAHTASAAIRFSLGKDNTPEEIDRTVDIVDRVVRRQLIR